MPRFQTLLVAYCTVLTTGFALALVSDVIAEQEKVSFREIDVQRINIREPDGTLRMTLSGQQAFPGMIIKGREQPHPGRKAAGMLFFNDEGTETGGLIFGGSLKNGKPTGGGSLTFDRYEQDQVIQVLETEDGERRTAGLIVSDRPDKRMDFAEIERGRLLPPGPQRSAAYARANLGGSPRVFVGRNADASSEMSLRDGQGRKRLILRVTEDGVATIQFLDEAGKTTRTVAVADPPAH